MFAYVPARGGSKRIPRKNVRPLGGKPLLLHVLDTLAQTRGLTGIGVSTEDPEILDLVAGHPKAVTLEPRDSLLADDVTGFLNLVRHDAPRFAAHFDDHEIMFVTATAALVPASAYEKAIARFHVNPRGLTLGVTAYEPSAMLALTGELEQGLTPLFPHMYTRSTKDLPGTFVDAGCFYLMDMELIEGIDRFLDLTPVQAVVLPREVGIDLDTEADWARLEETYARRHKDTLAWNM